MTQIKVTHSPEGASNAAIAATLSFLDRELKRRNREEMNQYVEGTIGQLLNVTKDMSVDLPLTWSKNDDLGFRITDVCSYRGYYCEAALVVDLVPIEEAHNVGYLRDRLFTLMKDTYYGYKGGEYKYGKNTTVFLVEEHSRTTFRDSVRTLKVTKDGTFKAKRSDR